MIHPCRKLIHMVIGMNSQRLFLKFCLIPPFKTNQYLERGTMTRNYQGIQRNRYFPDLNNLNVVTTTSDEYSTCFGFYVGGSNISTGIV